MFFVKNVIVDMVVSVVVSLIPVVFNELKKRKKEHFLNVPFIMENMMNNQEMAVRKYYDNPANKPLSWVELVALFGFLTDKTAKALTGYIVYCKDGIIRRK